ncbi:PQQ-dependent sugar dehydrogenase [Singulisphaera acidiphila]|uniref:Glucose/sorbosone dehydrogenase n=1 Tax=Singulisphaera acidiphila (strain ATCC BAA-1392 / DSM 18658 / VKM B-2454 / MOB10) TaxID=886293 RepID=L0DNM7_SINAD|nr:PQQ-dependent sugar dehydrogenase [Singulisphaera acidiphila]AGA30974.1 glucose/sorbosone dehydrogenase [Singulisphaera acidiphila DSM 18658]
MRQSLGLALVVCSAVTQAGAQPPPKPVVTGLTKPESVALNSQGQVFVSVIGESGRDGDGAVLKIEQGKAVPFASGLDDPKGLVAHQEWLFVADKDRVWRIDGKGKAEVFAPASAFPTPPLFLNDLAVDVESGTLYVSDSGNRQGGEGAVYRITPKGAVSLVLDKKQFPNLHTPNGLLLDGASHLLLADFGTGTLYRIKLADHSVETLADGLGAADGLAWDQFGRLFVSDWKGGRVFVIARPGAKPVLLAQGLTNAADLTVESSTKRLLVPDMGGGTVVEVPITVPGAEVNEEPLPLKTAVAFPDLQWAGWKGETEDGLVQTLRPLVLTHAGDGSNRVFVATQHGVIHAFPNDQKATQTTIFLDIRDRVSYKDETNEEGFLGLAFHPKFKENGYLYVFYTPKAERLTNVVSRFQVRKDDPSQADPASEVELLRFKKPYWNHDGGTVLFGPDGFLYVTHGDGGAGNDPHENGQNLETLLGKVLRIDVDHKEGDKNYAIPKDNPFVGRSDARPEIWAYGIRNIWRMAFDRKTGWLWAGEVGQNLWEEIDIITKGGNYGWNLRESLHPFGVKGVGPRPELIDPIWEYSHHDTGKSITGGNVYRGTRLPELDGAYLYADYVTGRLWALRYDDAQRRVVENRPIPSQGLPVLSFGEDEQGEVYFLTTTNNGQGIYRFSR